MYSAMYSVQWHISNIMSCGLHVNEPTFFNIVALKETSVSKTKNTKTLSKVKSHCFDLEKYATTKDET